MDRKRDLVWLISFTASKCHQTKEKEAWHKSFTRPSIEIYVCAIWEYGITPKNVPFQKGKYNRAGSMIE